MFWDYQDVNCQIVTLNPRYKRGIVIRFELSNTQDPEVSVIVATHNSGVFLEDAVRSVLSQTLSNIEVIIVDDCSSDNSSNIARRLADQDSRVTFHQLDKNLGPAGARNCGIALARGRWLAILDSDDMYASNRLEILVNAGEKQNADIVSDNLIVFDDANYNSAILFLSPSFSEGWITINKYLDETLMYGSGCNLGYLKPIFKHEKIKSSKILYDEQLRVGEDDDFIVRMLLDNFKYWLELNPGYGYRKHSSSISHRLSAKAALAMKHASAAIKVGQNYKVSPVIAASLARRHAGISRAAAFAVFIEALKQGNIGRALITLLRAPSIVPLLRMPIAALFGRLFPSAWSKASRNGDPRAVSALLNILK